MFPRLVISHQRFFLRFLLSGGLNSLATYLLYLLLLSHFPYKISYSVAFLSGVLLAYVLNRYFVFRTHQGVASVLAMPVIYSVQYFLGLAIIWILVEFFFMSPIWGPLVSVAVTVPVTYILSHRVFGEKTSRISLD